MNRQELEGFLDPDLLERYDKHIEDPGRGNAILRIQDVRNAQAKIVLQRIEYAKLQERRRAAGQFGT